jgi:hypothetical protein
MKKLLFALCAVVLSTGVFAKSVAATNGSSIDDGYATVYSTNGSASFSSTTQSGNTPDDQVVTVDNAVKCNQESYQVEGMLQGLAVGASKNSIAKLINDTPPALVNRKALLRDLDLITSTPEFIKANPVVIMDFVFKTCVMTAAQ